MIQDIVLRLVVLFITPYSCKEAVSHFQKKAKTWQQTYTVLCILLS